MVMSYMTFDAWLLARQNDFKAAYYKKAYEAGVASEQAAHEAQKKSEVASKTLENKVSIATANLEESTNDLSKYSNEITKINTKIQNGELTLENAKSHLEYYQHMCTQAFQKQTEEVKELKNLSTSNEIDILKSNLSEYLFNLIDFLKDYISLLTSEQLVILFNLSGYLLLFMIFTTITILLIGNDLINYYELE